MFTFWGFLVPVSLLSFPREVHCCTYHCSTIFPIIVDCCTEVAHHVPGKWLRRHVLRFDVQKGGDLCKIPAVILYTKRKKLCASPHNKNVKRWMRRMSKNHQKAVNHGRKRRKTKRRRKTTRKL